MKNSFGYIYKTTNLKNGRIYIGQKSGKFQPSYLGSGLIISRAVNRYGRDCFKVEILTHAKDRNKLNELERKFIAEYRKLFSGRLYNITEGGCGVRRPCPIKTKEKIRQATIRQMSSPAMIELLRSKAKQYYSIPENNPMFGKRHSEASRLKNRLSQLGKVQSIEARIKMSIARKGVPHSEQWKANMRHPHKSYPQGIPKSEEHKKNMRHPHRTYNGKPTKSASVRVDISGLTTLSPELATI
jgi:group I intron endonuclease